MAARMNISVPDKLKRQMDKVREPVNWSSLAARAFEQELGDIAGRKVKKKMSDVIQRLRASKIEDDSELVQQGVRQGRHWAEHNASARQLRRLANAKERLRDDGFAGQQFYFLIEPDDKGNRSAAREFWSLCLGDDRDTASEGEYVVAFAESALDVWDEVEGKL